MFEDSFDSEAWAATKHYGHLKSLLKSYTKRFVNEHSKKLKFPYYKYLDAKLHPTFRDHIVILSMNEFPENINLTYCWEDWINDISDIDVKYDQEFAMAIQRVLDEEKEAKSNLPTTKTTDIDSHNNVSANTRRTENVEETKTHFLKSETNADEELFEGGSESEEDAKISSHEQNKQVRNFQICFMFLSWINNLYFYSI